MFSVFGAGMPIFVPIDVKTTSGRPLLGTGSLTQWVAHLLNESPFTVDITHTQTSTLSDNKLVCLVCTDIPLKVTLQLVPGVSFKLRQILPFDIPA